MIIRRNRIVVYGGFGIVDAELVRYFIKQKKLAKEILVHVTHSINEEIASIGLIEALLSEIDCIDRVITSEEFSRLIAGKVTDIILLDDDKYVRYSHDMILNNIASKNEKQRQKYAKMIAASEFCDQYGDGSSKRIIKVGLVSGVFDLIHYGHIQLMQKAAELADIVLVVTMTTNAIKRLSKNHLNDRPIYSIDDRLCLLNSLRSVNHIIVMDNINCLDIIRQIHPDIYIKHIRDCDRHIIKEECRLVRKQGGEVNFMTEKVINSSSDIINCVRRMNENKLSSS